MKCPYSFSKYGLNQMSEPIVLFLIVLMASMVGCGGARPVTGGTEGRLRVGSDRLSEIQVTVKPIGFGIPGSDGVFRLVTNGATGALRLTPGEYRCTLESIGAPVVIPSEFAQAETTPLKVTWPTGDLKLDLDIPSTMLAK